MSSHTNGRRTKKLRAPNANRRIVHTVYFAIFTQVFADIADTVAAVLFVLDVVIDSDGEFVACLRCLLAAPKSDASDTNKTTRSSGTPFAREISQRVFVRLGSVVLVIWCACV